jgi:hypothetical protein
MPSLDTIRTITIKGQTEGVDQTTAALKNLTDAIKAANDNLSKGNAVAQDNSSGWRLTGEGAATAANHLRQAAEAAYAFSPAFRGVVNEMAVPALKTAGTALEAVASGIVTATNATGTGLLSLAVAAEKATPNFLGLTSGVRSAGIAMEAFAPTVGGVAISIAASVLRFVPLLGEILLVWDAIKLVGQAWELGGEKLAEYVSLSEKAVASGVSTDFFQRITKAATDAKIPVDLLTTALKTLNTATADQLGGSAGQQRLNQLLTGSTSPLNADGTLKAQTGNFQGNAGLAALTNANTTEEKFKAISILIDQAMQKGERLAALDVAKTFLGDAVAASLAKDSDYLDKMLASADKIKAEDLVSKASIDNAVELQNRLDAAEKILSERFHPIQDVLIQGGILMRETWVNVVENIAAAVDQITKFLVKVTEVDAYDLRTVGRMVNQGATAFMNLTTTPESRAASEASLGISSNPADIAMTAARQRLGSGLQNPANVSSSTDQINSIQNKVFPDVSKNPVAPVKEQKDAYDRAEESVLKYIETTKAASLAVSDAAGEQEKFKVIAQLTAAGIKDGLTPEAAKLKAEMSGLGQQAGAAADALAKAREVSNIDFGRKTAFLSADDVAIATQLKGIYGNDVPAALNSTYVAGIRVNTAFKDISSSIETNLTQGLTDIVSGAKSAGQAFSDMGKAIVTAIEQMIIKIAIVQPLMQALQNSIGGSGGIGSLLGLGGSNPIAAGGVVPGAVGPTSVGGGALVGLHAGGIVGAEATFNRYVHPAYFDNAPRFHSGGIAGDEVPIIAKRGEGVFTPGQMAAMGSGNGSQVNVSVMNFGNDNVSVTQKQNGNGGVDLELMVGQAAASQMAKKGSALRQVTDKRAILATR